MRTRKTLTIVIGISAIVTMVLLHVAVVRAITYGWPDENRHPNVGRMLVEIDGQWYGVCSGTLIAPKVFLTASHCTVFLPSLGIDEVWVTFDTKLPYTTYYRGVPHTNPNYDPRGSDPGDVAVIVLDDTPAGLTPASLPSEGMFDAWYGQARRTVKDQKFTAVGYGSLPPAVGGGPPRWVTDGTRRFAVSEFNALTKPWLYLMANDATGDGGTCYGDSGGPNFIGAGDGESPIIAGVTVKGDAMCFATNVIYRLDTPTARAFLGEYVVLP